MKPSDKRLYELERQRNGTLPPGSRWHQWWCAFSRGAAAIATTTSRAIESADRHHREAAS